MVIVINAFIFDPLKILNLDTCVLVLYSVLSLRKSYANSETTLLGKDQKMKMPTVSTSCLFLKTRMGLSRNEGTGDLNGLQFKSLLPTL